MRVFAELFAGAGGISKDVRSQKCGIAVISLDILGAEWQDILDDEFFGTLRGWITSYTVCGFWSGTPCETMSRARRAPAWSKFPHQLRSSEFVRGLPTLEGKDLSLVRRRNKIADRAGELLEQCAIRGIPAAEENPAHSFLWEQKLRKRLSSQGHDVVVDMCSFGCSYRKRTRVRTFNFQIRNSEQFVCHAQGGKCKFSTRPHVVLSGIRDRDFATRAASVYPSAFCELFGRALSTHIKRMRTNNVWEIMKAVGNQYTA